MKSLYCYKIMVLIRGWRTNWRDIWSRMRITGRSRTLSTFLVSGLSCNTTFALQFAGNFGCIICSNVIKYMRNLSQNDPIFWLERGVKNLRFLLAWVSDSYQKIYRKRSNRTSADSHSYRFVNTLYSLSSYKNVILMKITVIFPLDKNDLHTKLLQIFYPDMDWRYERVPVIISEYHLPYYFNFI